MTTGVTVDFNANLVRFTSGVDKAIADLNKFQSNAARTADAVKATFASLGAGLSVAAIVAWGKGTIDAADNMNDLSQRIGIGIKDLARWKLAAEQSGMTMESLAKGVKGLSTNMVEHGDKLRAAGITATDANGALVQLADIFSFLPDGVEKTALAVQLFGKAGMDMIPMLNLGSKGLLEAQEKSKKYAEELARLAPDADKFNDSLRELKMQSEASALSIMSKLTPGMEGLALWIKDARSGANGLADALDYIGEKMGDSEIIKAMAWMVRESGVARSQGYKGPKNKAGLPASAAEQFDMATEDFVAGGGIDAAYKRKAAAARAKKLLSKPAEKNTEPDSMLKRGQQNLYGSLDSEEEMRILAQKRTMEDAKKEFEDLQRMIKKGDENLLALYYETAGEEVMRLVAHERELKDAGKDAFADLTRAVEGWGNAFTDTMADMVMGGKAGFGDLANSIIRDLIRMQIQMSITKPLLDAFKDAGGVPGIFKSLFPGTSGGYGDTADVAAGVPQYAQGTPWVPNDGLAYLHQGEAVVPAAQNRGGGITVNIIEDSSKGGQVQQRQEGGQNMLDVFVERVKSSLACDISRGSGSVPAALAGTYGLNRAAGAY